MIVDIVLGQTGRGGFEKVLSLVSNELQNRGHQVRVCQAMEPKYLNGTQTFPVIYYYGDQQDGGKNNTVDDLIAGYQKLITRIGRPDIVVATQVPLFSYICRSALHFLGENCPPIISWLHGPPKVYFRPDLLKFSDAHLAISHSLSKKIKEVVGNNSPIHYVGNPVDIDNVNLINRPTDHFEFVYVGRLDNNQKRLDIMLKALGMTSGNWILRMIGDGPNKNEIKQLAEQLGIQDKIIYEGWKANPWDELKEASLLILSSDFEGFGLVLVEALARGIPVISTYCDGPDEIIQNEVNGWLYPKRDYLALHIILQKIINGDINLPSAKICRDSVLQYSPKIVIDSIEKILCTYVYRDIIKEKFSSLSFLPVKEIAQHLLDLIAKNNFNVEAVFSIIDNRYPNSLKSSCLTHLGVLFWENQMYENVIPSFQKALEYDPNNEDALFNLGYVLKYMGEEDLAINYFNNRYHMI